MTFIFVQKGETIQGNATLAERACLKKAEHEQTEETS